MRQTRWWCSKCEAELTEADLEAGECTQCHNKLPKVQVQLAKKSKDVEASDTR